MAQAGYVIRRVALLGATSLVGPRLLSALRLADFEVFALTRQVALHGDRDGVRWCPAHRVEPDVPLWISLAPVWTLADSFAHMQRCAVRRVIVLSSTSGWTKQYAQSAQERDTAAAIRSGEERLAVWAEQQGIEWIVLRTTLIHGEGRDRNVSDIARWLRRWHFFPLVGGGRGLRQPLHLRDVVAACLALAVRSSLPCASYNLVGAETLNYREMVVRIARAGGVPFIFLPVPEWAASVAIRVLACLPRFRHLTPDMVVRMNVNLIFDPLPLREAVGLVAGPFDPADSMSQQQDG